MMKWCPGCRIRVLPTADDRCPSCGWSLAAVPFADGAQTAGLMATHSLDDAAPAPGEPDGQPPRGDESHVPAPCTKEIPFKAVPPGFINVLWQRAAILVGCFWLLRWLIPSVLPRSIETLSLRDSTFVCIILALVWTGVTSLTRTMGVGRPVDNPVLQDQRVRGFYRNTMAVWSSRALSWISTALEEEATRLSLEKFIAKYPPAPNSPLDIFFTHFPPMDDEYLITLGTRPDVGSWFILTNERLIQRSGVKRATPGLEFTEIPLSDVASYIVEGTTTYTLRVGLKSGALICFENVLMWPKVEVVSRLLEAPSGTPPIAASAIPGAPAT